MFFILINDNLSEFDFYINAPNDLPGHIDFISGSFIKDDELKTP